MNFDNLKEIDPAIYEVVEKEHNRQESNIELIASENFTSKAVMEAMGSFLTNKYAEGYPGKRYYGGCHEVDVAENIARERLLELFGGSFDAGIISLIARMAMLVSIVIVSWASLSKSKLPGNRTVWYCVYWAFVILAFAGQIDFQ